MLIQECEEWSYHLESEMDSGLRLMVLFQSVRSKSHVQGRNLFGSVVKPKVGRPRTRRDAVPDPATTT